MPGTPFDAIFARYATLRGIPQEVIEGVARTESNLDPKAIGDKGQSFGLFQLYTPTARRLGFTGDMNEQLEPETATLWASLYMQQIIEGQGGVDQLNLPNFYSEYNSGRRNLWQTSQEVWDHVQNFLRNYALSIPAAALDAGGLLLVGLAVFLLTRKGK